VELNGEHLCPGCLESGRSKGKLTQLETKRTLYDGMALSAALLPLLAWPITLLTAPAAIFLAIYALRKPGSLLPRTRIRAYLAVLIGSAEFIGWMTYFVYLYVKR